MRRYYSNGKLLITGEYAVLDGALSLAIPTKFGQALEIETINESKLYWKSLDEKGLVWFKNEFELNNNGILKPTRKLSEKTNHISERLIEILIAAKKLNPAFLNIGYGFKITTKLDFPKHWGLGTSSTLINNISQWAQIDAYALLDMTFGGSGYDIACAQHNTPITYQLTSLKNAQVDRQIKSVPFNPPFKEHIYFVYLNQKQNSREGILRYKENKVEQFKNIISEIDEITLKLIKSASLSVFENLLTQHEVLVSKLIKIEPIKERLFSDFNGSIKSLGAWGGDFILVASENNPEVYFKSKGYHTILNYNDMSL